MPYVLRTALVVCLWLTTVVSTPAQPTARLLVDQWRAADGLPQDTVTSIAQDDRGYLWIATRKGLARYDGAVFTPIGPIGDLDIGNIRLTSVLPTPDGGLWLGTYGLGVIRVLNGSATRYGAAEGVPHEVVWDVTRDRRGQVWLASSRGARYFDGRRWVAPELPPDLADDGVNVVFEDRGGRLWLGTSRNGAVRLDGAEVTRFATAQGVPASSVWSVAEAPDGTIWLATPQGAARIDGNRVTTYGPAQGFPAERVLQVLVDRRGVVWMATHGGGLVRYDGGAFETFRRQDGLSSDYLISLAETRDGALWVGTLSGGLNRLAPTARELLDTRSGLPPYPVTTIYQHGTTREFWIGTYGGGLANIRNGRVRVYTTADGLPSNAITSLAGGKGDSVWVATNGEGAFRLAGGRVVERIGPDVVGSSLRTIEVDHDGSGALWFGGSGLVHYQGGSARGIGRAQGLLSSEVRVVYSTRERVWVGTYGGGLQAIERDGRIRSYGEAEGLTNPFVTSLHIDQGGTLWVGTYGGGLFRMRDERLSAVTVRDGLPDNVVFDVMEDNVGRLWLTGPQGLAVVRLTDVHRRLGGHPDLLSVSTYGRTEGVPGSDGTDGNQPLSWMARDGRLWFATVDGVVIFDPMEIADAQAEPTTHIDAVWVDKQPVPLTMQPTPVSARSLDITFSAPFLQGGRNVRYEYRLVGLDGAWVDAGTRRTASYTNLAPGDYHFEVRARARPGAPAGGVRTLAIAVPARFHERPGFYALAAALAGLAIVGLERLRVRHLHRRHDQLERLVEERTAALRHEMQERERAESERRALDERIQQAQRLESLGVLAGGVAHDFNNLLVGVLGEASLALSDLQAGAPARPHVERIERAALRASELTAQMLAYSGRGRFIAAPARLDELAGEVRELLGSVIPRSITVTLDFARTIPPVAGDPSQLRQVIMNLLTNAADAIGDAPGHIHVSAGTRTITPGEPETVTQAGTPGLSAGEYVWLEVRDDGAGMDAETQGRIFDPFFSTKPAGRGLGLAAALGIVRSHGGRILVASEPGAGSTFTLLFPAVQPVPDLLPAGRPRAGRQPAPTEAPRPPRVPDPVTPAAGAAAAAREVLVVDDERLVRDVARAALRRAGHAVTEVTTGEDAVALFEARPDDFGLVVLDLTLPGIQGRAVMQSIRALRPDLPIVLTSGYTAEEAGDLTTAPRTTFLQKPWRPDQLVRAVAALIDAGQAESAAGQS